MNCVNMSIHVFLGSKPRFTTIYFARERLFLQMNYIDVIIVIVSLHFERPLLGQSFLHTVFIRILVFNLSACCLFMSFLDPNLA